MTIQKQVSQLVKLRDKTDELKDKQTKLKEEQAEALRPLQEQISESEAERDGQQAIVMSHMSKLKFDALRMKRFTVSKQVRRTMFIENEQDLIKDLKVKELGGEYLEEKVKARLFLNNLEDENMFNGVGVRETEFVSIKKVIQKSKKVIQKGE